MNRQQTEILAKAIESESADAARLSNVKSALAMKGQALIGDLNLSSTKTVAFALEFAEQAEIAVQEWAEKRFKSTLTAGATADILEIKGEGIIQDFVVQLEQAQATVKRKQAERKLGVTRK